MPEITMEELFSLLLEKQDALNAIAEKLEELEAEKDEMGLDKYLEEVEKLHVRSEILIKELEDLGPSVEALNPDKKDS